MQSAWPVQPSLAGALFSVLELSLLLLSVRYLAGIGLRAVVLAVGLWLVMEVLWLQLGKRLASDDSSADPRGGPPLLRAFFYRSLLLAGFASLLSLLLTRLGLIVEPLLLPSIGLSIGPLLSALHVLQLHSGSAGHGSLGAGPLGVRRADPVIWFRQRLLRRSGTVLLAGLVTTAQLLTLLTVLILLWLEPQGWLFWRVFAPVLQGQKFDPNAVGDKGEKVSGWDFAKTVGGLLWDKGKSWAGEKINNFTEGAKEKWEGVKHGASDLWNGAKEKVSDGWQSAKDTVAGWFGGGKKQVNNNDVGGADKGWEGAKQKTPDKGKGGFFHNLFH